MHRHRFWRVWLLGLAGLVGCRALHRPARFDAAAAYQPFLQQIEYPDVATPPDARLFERDDAPPPSVRNIEQLRYWDISLADAIRLALSNSAVIRELGGRVLSAPAAAATVYDPALQEMDPRTGVEAALADFDARFTTNFSLVHSERRFNNFFFGQGALGLKDLAGDFRAGITKTAATGTQFTAENLTTYDRNNSPANLFPSVYDTVFRAGVRHPLLQGGGIEFNRIAGPGATPGNYRGVLLARINSDVAIADFQAAVRDVLREVQRTYWELHFAYRDLEAKRAARWFAYGSWKLENDRYVKGAKSRGDEAFARNQYYSAQVAVENALSGTPNGPLGVLGVERQLRYLLGLPANDGGVLRPSTSPLTAPFQFDWGESLDDALTRRVELRRQQWKVKQRQLELVAARNFQRMRLDLVGDYRWRGFGDDLFGSGDTAFASLLGGDLQGWTMGLELTTPVGNRIGHAAARHAMLQLAREKAVLIQQQRLVISELRAAFTELDRAQAVSQSNYNRRVAAFIQLESETEKNEAGTARLDVVLEAQRRAAEAQISFQRSIADYNVAIADLEFARGTLLDSLQVHLAEGPWSAQDHVSARKQARRFCPAWLERGRTVPPPLAVPAPSPPPCPPPYARSR